MHTKQEQTTINI